MQEDRSLNLQIKLYYDLHLPEVTPAPLLIALHGYGAHKLQMMREGLKMASPAFAVASLQGFHQHMKEPRVAGGPMRFGFGWLTNYRSDESVALHHRALLDLIDQLNKEGVIDPTRIFLIGFSQSCALNYRFAFTHPDKLKGIIGICGGIPGDWDTSEIYKPTNTAVFHLNGTRDEFYTSDRVKNYEQQLRTRAREVTWKDYDAAHEIIEEMREDVRTWILEHVNAT
jgi:phospholipase/carboxylesterase